MQLESTAKDALLSWDNETLDTVVQRDVKTLKYDYPGEYKTYVDMLREQRKEGIMYEQSLHLSGKEAVDRMDTYLASGVSRLRSKQHDAFTDIREHVVSGERKGYVKLPTGTGKTVVFTELTKALDTKTLIVVPRKLLVRQTANRFKEFAPDMQVGMYFGEEKQNGKQVTITTYESLDRLVASGTIHPDDYGLVVMDEAHRSLTKRRIQLFQHFTKAHKFGFSATPTFSQEKRLQRLLGKEIHTMSIEEAVSDRLLSPFTAHVYTVEMPEDAHLSEGAKGQKLKEQALKNKVAVDLTLQQFLTDKIIANCVSIRHADSLVEEYLSKGITAAAIHGQMSRAEQRKVLHAYETKQIQVLCNVDLLTEGFDDPSVSVCLNLRDSYSRITTEQRAGRVLRLDPKNPRKHAHVADIVMKNTLEQKRPILFIDVITANPLGSAKIPISSEISEKSTTEGADLVETFTLSVDSVLFSEEESLSVIPQSSPEEEAEITEWLTTIGISKLPQVVENIGEYQVRRLLNEYGKNYPEHVRMEKKPGQTWIYFHPEAARYIIEQAKARVIPSGWILVAEAQKTHAQLQHIGPVRVRKLLEPYLKQHPEHVKTIKRGPIPWPYFHPDAIAYAIEAAKTMQVRPENWFQVVPAAKAIGRDPRVFKNLAESFREEHPEWFGHYLDKEYGANYTEYFAPELIERVQALIQEQPPTAPEGWVPRRDLPSVLGKSLPICLKLLEFASVENPALGRGKYLNHRNQITEFISPELIEVIKKAFPA